MSDNQEYLDFPDVLRVNNKGSEKDYIRYDVAAAREEALIRAAVRHLTDELLDGDNIYKRANLARWVL